MKGRCDERWSVRDGSIYVVRGSRFYKGLVVRLELSGSKNIVLVYVDTRRGSFRLDDSGPIILYSVFGRSLDAEPIVSSQITFFSLHRRNIFVEFRLKHSQLCSPSREVD